MDSGLNYFNYFTEIEQFYQSKRESFTLLSTLDWVLIENWKNQGIPLDVVLKGIERAFSKSKRRINSLAYCVGAINEVVEELRDSRVEAPTPPPLESSDVQAYVDRLANETRALAERYPEVAGRIAALADHVAAVDTRNLRAGEQELTALEEKLVAVLQFCMPEDVLFQVRRDVDRDLGSFRSTMTTDQITMLDRQLVKRKLLEQAGAPRLSLFYMT